MDKICENKQMGRLYYLDMAKGIAIFLVVVGHIYTGTLIKTWLYSFHLPLFFIVSGCLINYKNEENQNMKQIIIKKTKSLIIPYITFSILVVVLGMILSKFSAQVLIMGLKDTLTLSGVGAMWFLPALFIAELLFHIMKKIIRKDYIRIFITVALFFIPLSLSRDSNIILIIIARSFIALGFITIGYYIFRFISRIDLPCYLIAVLFISNIFLSQYNGLVDLHFLIFNQFFLYSIGSILGSISMILLFKKCKNIKILSYWGVNSLIIMSTHINIRMITPVVISYIHIRYIPKTVLIIVIMILEYPIITIINNYMPIMLGKRKTN